MKTRKTLVEWYFLGRERKSLLQRFNAPRLFVGSFLLLELFGTLGLKLIPGLYVDEQLGWLDALFTATSAICVTGLIVVDTATYFTPLGQGFILLLIQLGGLGIIAFTTLIIVALGGRLSLHHETVVSTPADVAPQIKFERLTRDVLIFTFVLEGFGAVLLYLFWGPEVGWTEAIWPSIFHSISAFCNAGFSTFPNNLIGFRNSSGILITIMFLIAAGGIGFLTMEEILLWYREKRQGRRYRISLHSRIVLVTTGVLIVGGGMMFALFEWGNTLKDLPFASKLVNALFLSVTARTAGFNAIDYAHALDSTNFFTVILMFIGGSPGSTAGGLKTTTVALLVLVAWSRFRGMRVTSIWGRSIPEETTERAVGLTTFAVVLLTAGIFIYTTSETPASQPGGSTFLAYVFEAVSAFNTVGLSMGVTPGLSDIGKATTSLLMFLGRVGPLTFAAALVFAMRGGGRFRYAYEDVVVG